MKIQLKQITVRELTENYENKFEEGVFGFNNKLNIRPAYQREFIYKPAQQVAVMNTLIKDFPLNVFYWVKNEANDEYEVLDGQQRTMSICEYVAGNYSLDYRYFTNLTKEEQDQILDYEIMVYFCEGTDKEKLDWFKTINIAGEKLLQQELRNAIYTGTWLSDAKRHFSKTNCAASNRGGKYVKGVALRQEILETVIKWKSEDNIENYMAIHQNDTDANELWQYFLDVVNWVEKLFPKERKDQKGIEWGFLYNKYKNNTYNSNTLEARYLELIEDENLNNSSTSGIYYYLITGEEKHLSKRLFTDKQKRIAFQKQDGVCVKCESEFEYKEMEGDHIIAWSNGGHTTQENLQMLCKRCNATKGKG